MNGHIKIERKIIEWEWYKDVNTCKLFLHLILKANWNDGRFMGIEIPRGSFVSSYQNLALETGLSVQNVRTALNHLKSTGELTVNQHRKFSVFTIENYCKYQVPNTICNNQLTDNQQSINNQLTTIEEIKKVRKKENNNNVAHFVPPTLENVIGYCQEKGITIDVECFIDFYESKGWMIGKNKMKDWKAAVRNWARQDKQAPAKKIRTTGFSNFDQRDYDMDKLERQLLESQ